MQTATKIVRILADRLSYEFYNDRIKNGRSYKVPGWKIADYEAAAQACKDLGFEAFVVTVKQFSWYSGHYLQTRLHVINKV